MPRIFHVYILASRSRRLYTGVTNNIQRRVAEHKAGTASTFTAKYRINRLVFAQEFSFGREALEAEKKIKGWIRAKKIALIEEQNKEWRDMSEDWF